MWRFKSSDGLKALTRCSLLLAACLFGQSLYADERRSGFQFMGPSTQSLQSDDALNPAMLWVKQGEALWQSSPGGNNKACVSCHGQAAISMRGTAARYPAFDTVVKRPINLGQRINQCRQIHQHSPPWPLEGQELLSLESYVALQSRGLAISPDTSAQSAPYVLRGKQRYEERIGQLNLSCAQCHDQRWGQRLGGSVIPQSHPTGYPLYRLEWQSVGSLQRRLRNCMSGVRSEPYAFGAIEMVEIELYLAHAANGMMLESPAVRP
jgi:L-cysteine S-thiosulfotransferase